MLVRSVDRKIYGFLAYQFCLDHFSCLVHLSLFALFTLTSTICLGNTF